MINTFNTLIHYEQPMRRVKIINLLFPLNTFIFNLTKYRVSYTRSLFKDTCFLTNISSVRLN